MSRFFCRAYVLNPHACADAHRRRTSISREFLVYLNQFCRRLWLRGSLPPVSGKRQRNPSPPHRSLCLERLENRVVPSISNVKLVVHAYVDLLTRQPDASGLTFWASQLDA